MCVIAKGARKDLRADEFRQCMKTNGYGFFVAVLKKDPAGNRFVRTLDEEEAFKAYDAAEPDDTVVLHARIPSRGGHDKNLADVHGWASEEGIRFCHNGTVVSLDRVQKDDGCEKMTDSEYFFRRIFLPLYRSEGGKWTELVDRIVKVVCGENRFLFIFPDNTVKTVGPFLEDHGCVFSNCSYMVPKPVAAPRIHFASPTEYHRVPAVGTGTFPGFEDVPGSGAAMLEAVGHTQLIRLATMSLAAASLTARAAKDAGLDEEAEKLLLADMFRGLPYPLGPTPDFATDLSGIFEAVVMDRSRPKAANDAVDELADLFGDSLVSRAVPGPVGQKLFKNAVLLSTRVRALLRASHNAQVDPSSDNPSGFVRAFRLNLRRNSAPKPVMLSQQFVYGGVAEHLYRGDPASVVPGVRALLQLAARRLREGALT